MKKKSIFRDHSGKPSQGRIAALAGTATGCALALAPLWGGPQPTLEILMVVMGGPGALALWQKIQAPTEKPNAEEN